MDAYCLPNSLCSHIHIHITSWAVGIGYGLWSYGLFVYFVVDREWLWPLAIRDLPTSIRTLFSKLSDLESSPRVLLPT